MKLKNSVLANALALSLPLLLPFGTSAQEANAPEVNAQETLERTPPDATSNVFRLGQIVVTGKRENESAAIGSSTLTSEEMQDFSKDGLEEALDIIPGVSTTTGSGNRNETGLSVRGFNRYQIPLYMDGIRLYLPVDGRVDYDRFLTPDLSEVQVQKGYVSVLNGPDGMGGAINLTTRKPVKPFEAELRMSAKFGEGGQYSGYTGYANIGGKQEKYYWQVSGEQRDFDHWRMSRDYKPTTFEDGGKRNNSGKKDWRGNLKVGFTPNATDEYSLNYVKQEGEKHGVDPTNSNPPRFPWDWPKWNASSLYFLSHTQLGEKNYVKTRLYYNTFNNDLLSYTDRTRSTRDWLSHYDDNSTGGSVEFGTTALPRQTLKAAFHFRRDQHKEWDDNFGASPSTDPKQETLENNYSFALEDTVHITSNFDLIAGVSRDIRRSKKAEEFAPPAGSPSGTPKEMMDFEIADRYATNWQGAAIYRYREGGKAHFSVSKRVRFPTMFDRFSTRFGSAVPNPYVRPERATNFELGISDQIRPGLRVEAAIFHNKFKDAINWVDYVDGNGNCIELAANGADCKTTPRNLGKATYQGFETAIHAQVMAKLELGGNYTYMTSKVDDPNYPDYKLTTAPRHKAFLYARWKPINDLKVIPSFEYGGTRWSDPSSGSGYVRTGNFKLFNLKVEYQITRHWDVSLAAHNLFDKNYELSDGYPEEGRTFLLSTRVKF